MDFTLWNLDWFAKAFPSVNIQNATWPPFKSNGSHASLIISDCFLLRCIPYKTLKAIWKQLSPNNASVFDSFWYDALSKRIQKATKNQALESSNFTEICHSTALRWFHLCYYFRIRHAHGLQRMVPQAGVARNIGIFHMVWSRVSPGISLYILHIPNSTTCMTRMTMSFGWRCEPGIFNLILKRRKDWNLSCGNQETLIQFKVWSCWVSWVVKMIYHPIIRPWKLSHGALDWNIYVFFCCKKCKTYILVHTIFK